VIYGLTDSGNFSDLEWPSWSFTVPYLVSNGIFDTIIKQLTTRFQLCHVVRLWQLSFLFTLCAGVRQDGLMSLLLFKRINSCALMWTVCTNVILHCHEWLLLRSTRKYTYLVVQLSWLTLQIKRFW